MLTGFVTVAYYILFAPTWRSTDMDEEEIKNRVQSSKRRLITRLTELNMNPGQIFQLINYAFDEIDRALHQQDVDQVYQPVWIISLLGLLECGRELLGFNDKYSTKNDVLINPKKDINLDNKTSFGYCLDSCPDCGKKRLVAVNPISNTHIYLKCKFCK